MMDNERCYNTPTMYIGVNQIVCCRIGRIIQFNCVDCELNTNGHENWA